MLGEFWAPLIQKFLKYWAPSLLKLDDTLTSCKKQKSSMSRSGEKLWIKRQRDKRTNVVGISKDLHFGRSESSQSFHFINMIYSRLICLYIKWTTLKWLHQDLNLQPFRLLTNTHPWVHISFQSFNF